MPPENVFEELKRFVGFSPADERRLRALAPRCEPHLPAIAAEFYARVSQHGDAIAVLDGSEAQIEALSRTLIGWIGEALGGPWDADYHARRARVGRRHVEIGLPQRYMFGAMSIIRGPLTRLALESEGNEAERQSTAAAVDRLLDLELAVMLETYAEASAVQLRRHERLASWGQLAAAIAHELRNPLGVMDSSLYLLARRFGGDVDAARHVARLRRQVDRADAIVSHLLDLVRDREPDRRPTAVAPLIQHALSAPALRLRGARVDVEVPDSLPTVHVDPGQLELIVVNLVQNAADAVGVEGRLRLLGRAVDDGVELVVEDEGPGLGAEARARLFEPLFTTKPHGTGLGLALCQRLVHANGGSIEPIAGPSLGGAAFRVWLPRSG
jgi:signal transduction histidine kinase